MISFPFTKKQIEEGLADKGSLVRIIMDSLPDHFFFKDSEQRFLGVNKTMAGLMGLSDPQEAVGKTDFDIFQAQDARKIQDDDKQVLQSARAIVSRERQAILKNGQTIWLSEHRIPLTDESGKTVGLVGLAVDITSIKKMETELRNTNMRLSGTLAELKQTQRRVIQHERLNALGEMASGIAHDFNNALMPILGYSDVLIAKPEILDDREETLSMLKDIRTAAVDASQVIRRLHEFYRSSAEDEEAAGDLNKQVMTAVVLTRPKWDAEMGAKGIHIKVETDLGDIPFVNAKESRLREVLLNLILNAIDAMPKGGTITLRTGLESDRVVLEIRDTGVGMTDDVRKRCFEPFFTTKGDEGTGLGLPLTYGFVQRHKGTIDIDSELGKGTVITIRLPCQRKPEVTADEPVDSPDKPTARMRVLIIDDELAARTLLVRYLRADRHTAVTADGGEDGLAKFRSGKFDLVITDRAMPDMSGDQVAEIIRKENPDVPVVMLTGFGDIMKEDGHCPLGVNLILSKPITRGARNRSRGQEQDYRRASVNVAPS
jgi:PAS domain S-box-containing protein